MTLSPTAPVEILNTRFHPVVMNDAVDLVFEWAKAPLRTLHSIVTINVALLMMCRSNAELAHAVEEADLVVADGMPLVWASHWLSPGLPERVAGVDLMELVLRKGASSGLRIFLLGTTQERLDVLQAKIRREYPGLIIAGARNGYFRPTENQRVVQEIRESGADVLFIGMPAPTKEIWTEHHRHELGVAVVVGVGGGFDVIAGFIPRAPKFLQRIGFEWAWRLLNEPRKLWKRYLVTNSQFIAVLVAELAGRLVGGWHGPRSAQ